MKVLFTFSTNLMQDLIPVKFISHLLLLVMALATVQGMHECCSSAAACSAVSATGDTVNLHQEIFSDLHHSPCSTPAEHTEHDGCDTCVNCPCHTPLGTLQPLLNYNPLILTLHVTEPFRYLPEVYLSKFIPPQNLA